MNRDAIIEKIKKLLRMKRGCTQGEIENALAMAAELARKHGIDLAGIDPDSEEQKISHVEEILKSRMPAEARFAAAILVNFFNVQVVLISRNNPARRWERQYVLNLIGTAWDAEVARYVFAFLQTHFRHSWSHRPNRRIKNRYAFLNGMFIGLAYKLQTEREAQSNEAGLILIGKAVELRKAYVEKHFPNCEDSPLDKDDSGAAAARRAGIRAGEATNIRKAVDSTPAPVRQALPAAASPTGQLALL